MKKFYFKFALYVLPILLYVGPALISGEALPVKVAAYIRKQIGPSLYGTLRDNYFVFKLAESKARKPDVLVVGSSRVMEFRSVFMKNGVFYNAGGVGQNLASTGFFIDKLFPRHVPKIILLGIDQGWVGPADTEDIGNPVAATNFEDLDFAAKVFNITHELKNIWNDPSATCQRLLGARDPIHGFKAFGASAIFKGKGFRADGSYQYGDMIKLKPSLKERMLEGHQRTAIQGFPYLGGDHINPHNLELLRRFLDKSRAHGVKVIGFLTPFAQEILAEMRASKKFTVYDQLDSRVGEIFKQYGFWYYNFTDIAKLKMTDADMLDGCHSGERINLAMIKSILDQSPDSPLHGYTSSAHIAQFLAESLPGNWDTWPQIQ